MSLTVNGAKVLLRCPSCKSSDSFRARETFQQTQVEAAKRGWVKAFRLTAKRGEDIWCCPKLQCLAKVSPEDMEELRHLLSTPDEAPPEPSAQAA